MGKNWYDSKTFWAGLLLLVYAVGKFIKTGNLSGDELVAGAMGFGLIGLRTAKEPIEPKKEK